MPFRSKTTLQDTADTQSDVVFIHDEVNDVVLIQDREPAAPTEPEFLTDEQEVLLIDAGPVFRGPVGPSLFDVWKEQGHSGTFDDFLETLRGPPGVAPPASGTSFTYEQTFAASIWNIVHNLGRIPSVTLIDTYGDEFSGDIRYVDNNTVRVTLIAATAGKAVLN